MGGLTIENCENYANITGANRVGGFVGTNFETKMKFINCANYGMLKLIRGGSHTGVGGLIGLAYTEISVYNCANYGELVYLFKGGPYSGVGGIIGNANGTIVTIINSFNFGKLNVNNNCTSYGGLFGVCKKDDDLQNIYYNNYYNNEYSNKIIGNLNKISLNVIGKSSAEFNLDEFVESLNNIIRNGKVINKDTNEEITINTTGWAYWKLKEGKYPVLDFNNIK